MRLNPAISVPLVALSIASLAIEKATNLQCDLHGTGADRTAVNVAESQPTNQFIKLILKFVPSIEIPPASPILRHRIR